MRSRNPLTFVKTTAVVLAGSFLLALAGAACSAPEAPAPVKDTVRTASSDRSATPATYGIDEVVPASLTREELPGPGSSDGAGVPGAAPEPATVPDPGSAGFLLPQLGLFAGDGLDHRADGERLFSEGRWLEAAAHLQVALEEDPDSWYAGYLLGLSLWRAGDLPGAEAGLRRAAELRPGFVKTHINLSRVLNDAGRPGEALAAADRAVDLAPDSAVAHYLRGRSLANLERPADAEAALAESLELDSGNGDVWNRLGLLLLRQGRDEEAVAALERAVALRPGPAYVHNNLGLAYEQVGRLADAERELAAAVDRSGEDSPVAASLARVRDVLGLPAPDEADGGDGVTAVAGLPPAD